MMRVPPICKGRALDSVARCGHPLADDAAGGREPESHPWGISEKRRDGRAPEVSAVTTFQAKATADGTVRNS